jgi:hypothetical protein
LLVVAYYCHIIARAVAGSFPGLVCYAGAISSPPSSVANTSVAFIVAGCVVSPAPGLPSLINWLVGWLVAGCYWLLLSPARFGWLVIACLLSLFTFTVCSLLLVIGYWLLLL